MMVRVKMNEIDTELTEDEIKELEEAEDRPIVYDVDSPQMTSKMLNQFHAFDAVSYRRGLRWCFCTVIHCVFCDICQKSETIIKDGFFRPFHPPAP